MRHVGAERPTIPLLLYDRSPATDSDVHGPLYGRLPPAVSTDETVLYWRPLRFRGSVIVTMYLRPTILFLHPIRLTSPSLKLQTYFRAVRFEASSWNVLLQSMYHE